MENQETVWTQDEKDLKLVVERFLTVAGNFDLEAMDEEYSDISLHYPLFNINQLLYKAYNGTFSNTKASRLKLEIEFHEAEHIIWELDHHLNLVHKFTTLNAEISYTSIP